MNMLSKCQQVVDVLNETGIIAELIPDFRDDIIISLKDLNKSKMDCLIHRLEEENRVYKFLKFNPKTQTYSGKIKVKNED